MSSKRMRFSFGKNWISFAEQALSSEHVAAARQDFYTLLEPQDLSGKKFIDIGFGQGIGLFLAAEAGAQVEGLDVDSFNTEAIKATARFFPDIAPPKTHVGSILDTALIDAMIAHGKFDIVHSWGAFNHTGDLRAALAQSMRLVKDRGLLVLGLYKSHWSAPIWYQIKKLYNHLPGIGQKLMIALFYPLLFAATWFYTGKSPHGKRRGMDFYHDLVDWIGGWPYEYIDEAEVREFLKANGFEELKFYPAKVPTGNNEYVFRKV